MKCSRNIISSERIADVATGAIDACCKALPKPLADFRVAKPLGACAVVVVSVKVVTVVLRKSQCFAKGRRSSTYSLMVSGDS